MRLLRLAALLACAACSTTGGGSGRVLNTDIFEDLPAPKTASYRYQNGESFAYRAKTFRCGRFLYRFAGPVDEATGFFRDTMTAPPYNWTLADEQTPAEGSTILVFTKADDRCTVDIDRLSGPEESPPDVTILVRLNYRR